MKRALLMSVMLAFTAMFCTVVHAGDVSNSVLNSLGLGEMKTMSDADGMAVRGKTAIHLGHSGIEAVQTDGYFILLTPLSTRSGKTEVRLPMDASFGIDTAKHQPPVIR